MPSTADRRRSPARRSNRDSWEEKSPREEDWEEDSGQPSPILRAIDIRASARGIAVMTMAEAKRLVGPSEEGLTLSSTPLAILTPKPAASLSQPISVILRGHDGKLSAALAYLTQLGQGEVRRTGQQSMKGISITELPTKDVVFDLLVNVTDKKIWAEADRGGMAKQSHQELGRADMEAPGPGNVWGKTA